MRHIIRGIFFKDYGINFIVTDGILLSVPIVKEQENVSNLPL